MVYRAEASWLLLRLVGRSEPAAGAPFSTVGGSDRVSAFGEAAGRAGLARGDRVIAVAGRPYRGRSVLVDALERARPGEALAVTIERAASGETVTLAVPLPELRPPRLVFLLTLGLLNPALCLLLGFGVALLRPLDGRAWALLLALLAFSQISDAGPDSIPWPSALRRWALPWDIVVSNLWAVGMLLLAVSFPDRLELDRRRPWLKWLLIVPVAGLALASGALGYLDSEDVAAAAGVRVLLERLGPVPTILQMVGIGCFFASIGFRGAAASGADAKRRLKLLYWGAGIGLTPTWFVLLYGMLTARGFGAGVPEPVLVGVFLLLPLFPLTLAHVIVVERAMDVRVVVRQGLQYALAQRGVLVAQAIASVAVLFFAVNLALDPAANRPRRLSYVAWGVVFVVVSQRLAERARSFIDRRFFREAVNAEQVLSELSDEVRTIVLTDALLETVARRIAAALHVPRVAILLREGDFLQVAHRLGGGPGAEARIAGDGATARRLVETRDALRVYLDDPQSWANRDPALAPEREALRAIGSQLLLPLALNERLLGCLSLGPKASEEPYSPADVRMLRSVAAQTALALENSRLTAAVAAEVARTARLNREIEIAREVQERLFPQSRPAVAGLDYGGRCRPAAGVGGDYYDFLDLGEAGLGVAVGDVSGKGVPAALLMASLQASLRGQTLAGVSDLALLMDHVNQMLVDASAANRYATFFYGQYEPRSRRLAYVNAGHNAPMLLRGHGAARRLIRLDQGGPVVGLFYPAPYQEARLVLEPGDLLVGFTDGISESMNQADEEWGEARLLEAVEACAGLPAEAVIDRVIAAADAFAGGARQHDDMTLVVVRVL